MNVIFSSLLVKNLLFVIFLSLIHLLLFISLVLIGLTCSLLLRLTIMGLSLQLTRKCLDVWGLLIQTVYNQHHQIISSDM